MAHRREFLRGLSAFGAGLVAGGGRGPAGADPAGGGGKMELLVLGGTGFIGPHLVRHAVARGHHVTIFTRGRRDADLPAGVVRLVGDRKGDLKSLEGKSWDAVVDDSATNPEWVRLSTELLKGKVGRYLFTSSTGVYYPYLVRGLDEAAPVRLKADDPKDLSATYGADKANCERIVRSAFGAGAVVVRPTYIVGPGDTSDRFPYWPQRLARGGETLAPGRRDDPVQFIDVRDLAGFMVHLLEEGREGVYNAAGPRGVLTMPEFLEQARAALRSDAQFVQIDDYDFLSAHGIEEAIPWAMLRGNDAGMMSIRHGRAEDAGLAYRPIAETVRDTRAWWDAVPEARREAPKFAISPPREAGALAAWKARGE
ncbi:dTDP-4-oxo-6-deoxy-D-allose reductase [Aquisphaera giovannonii]|uniref:dTDP-4-oxo-6-deoxy-D-allose reductase n=1 Tax=Aquisphaera giovannonii TaxID=406548 RepID=A0A5B9W526_9BACT|nr:NAD-dependent epimerase/dehydratase family protein [Aquisphaera giovannonii]QEH35702.1 dTDP-4-oxo-6-deoxy-D-allose reductase [Aquisphaera giovannonii]